MANLGGYEFEGVDALKQRADQMIQKMRSSSNPETQRAANSQQVISAIFGSPEMRKAKATEDTISGVLSNTKRTEGESELDFQIRQNTAMREGMAKIDPKIALQANDRILGLMNEKLERKKLSQDVEKGAIDINELIWTHAQAKRGVIFKVGKDGVNRPIDWLDADATVEEKKAILESYGEGYDLGTGLDAMKLDDASIGTAGSRGMNPSTKAKYISVMDANAAFARGLSNVMETLSADPLALTNFAQVEAEGGGLVVGMTKLYKDFLGDDPRVVNGYLTEEEAAQHNQGRIDSILESGENGQFFERLKAEGKDAAVAKGIVTNLAYTLAKALDPGGRLSDQDVKMAMEMLTGNGDPEAIVKLFELRLNESFNSSATAREYAESGWLDGHIGKGAVTRFDSDVAKARENLAVLHQSIQDANLFSRKQLPPGAGQGIPLESAGNTNVETGIVDTSGMTNDELFDFYISGGK